MAQTIEKSVKELEEEITCSLCLEHYIEPKVLPCCHYFCKQCIHQLTVRKGIDKPFSCPECRQDTTLPQGGVDQLKTAFFINRMKGVHSKLEQAHGKVEAKCEECSGGKAEAFCRQCTQFICAECVMLHQKLRIYAEHKTVSLDELKEGGAKGMIKEEPPLQMCTTHKEPMKIYCFTCSCLICRDCTVIDHAEHKYDFVVTSAPKTKEMLIQHLEPLKEVQMNLSRAVEEIQTTKCEIGAQGDSVANEIKSSFAEYRKIVNEREQELLKEAEVKVTEKLGHLSGQEKSLSTECAIVQGVIDYTQQCVEHSTDDEIMCMHGDIQSRIDRETKEHQKEGKSLVPVEEADVGVEVSSVEELRQFFQTKANMFQIPIEGVMDKKNADVDKNSEFLLLINLSNGQRMKRKCAVESQLKSLCDGSTVQCNVDPIEVSKYRIFCKPIIRGRHELIVTANGLEVAGSPFPVFVSIHPTQLGKPDTALRDVPGMRRPGFVAINSKGELIISEPHYRKDVVVMNSEGKELRKLSESGISLSNPIGVAVDDSDNIYIADYAGNKIIKVDRDLKEIAVADTKKYSWQSLFGVAVVGDEVMVCNAKNNSILVYTKELEYSRQINPPKDKALDFQDIRDVSSSEDGNLYVSCYGNSRIHVFSNGGEYLRSFGCDGSGVDKLSGPCGIYISSPYVYVSNWTDHTVGIYTTSGEYVTSLGKKQFCNPWGVCVDRDGFVYVCDYSNDRLQVY